MSNRYLAIALLLSVLESRETTLFKDRDLMNPTLFLLDLRTPLSPLGLLAPSLSSFD